MTYDLCPPPYPPLPRHLPHCVISNKEEIYKNDLSVLDLYTLTGAMNAKELALLISETTSHDLAAHTSGLYLVAVVQLEHAMLRYDAGKCPMNC